MKAVVMEMQLKTYECKEVVEMAVRFDEENL